LSWLSFLSRSAGSLAATFAAAGLPDGFHRGAGEIYRRMAVYKDAAAAPSMDDVAKTLLKEPGA